MRILLLHLLIVLHITAFLMVEGIRVVVVTTKGPTKTQ